MQQDALQPWYHADRVPSLIHASQKKRSREEIVEQLREAHIDHGYATEHDDISMQVNAWRNSIRELGRVLRSSELSEDNWVILEAILKSRKKFDAVICGRCRGTQPSVVPVECKAWHPRRRGKQRALRYDVIASSQSGKILTYFFDTPLHELTERGFPRPELEDSPLVQIQRYVNELRGGIGVVLPQGALAIHPCLHLYNADRCPRGWWRSFARNVLPEVRQIPVLTRGTSQDFADFLTEHTGQGGGEETLTLMSSVLQHSITSSEPVMNQQNVLEEDIPPDEDERRHRSYMKKYLERAERARRLREL
jgi:hypothetical protein